MTRAGNSGGTREPSSQKDFGLAESFCGFGISTKLNSKLFLKLYRDINSCDILMITSAGIHHLISDGVPTRLESQSNVDIY